VSGRDCTGLRRRRWKRPEFVRVSGNKSARRTDAHLHKRTHHAPRTTHAHARTRARAHARTHTHTHDGVDTNETLEGAPCALLPEFELRERLLDICFGSVAGARAGAACTERLIRQRVPPPEITHTHMNVFRPECGKERGKGASAPSPHAQRKKTCTQRGRHMQAHANIQTGTCDTCTLVFFWHCEQVLQASSQYEKK